MAISNPFRIGGSVTGEFFTDRAETLQRIERALQEPQAKLLVFGPRRMGKTSALEVAIERARRKEIPALLVDFSAATALTDLANRLLHGATALLGRERSILLDLLSHVQLGAGIKLDPVSGAPELSIEVSRRDAPLPDQRGTLEGVLDAIEALAQRRGHTIGVVIDEFQEIVDFGGEDAEWHLRGVIQRHKHLSYVCAGSKEGLIRAMSSRNRAFYKLFEQHHVGPIDPDHMARWIEARMEGAGVRCDPASPSRIVALAGPRTRDIVQLARATFEIAAAAATASEDGVERAFHLILSEEDHVLRADWSQLPALQQNLLRAVAAGETQLTSRGARDRFSLSASGSVVPALQSLVEKELLTRESDGAYRFDSPFMRGWVILNTLPDVGVFLDPTA